MIVYRLHLSLEPYFKQKMDLFPFILWQECEGREGHTWQCSGAILGFVLRRSPWWCSGGLLVVPGIELGLVLNNLYLLTYFFDS